jgi:hypothetical protein
MAEHGCRFHADFEVERVHRLLQRLHAPVAVTVIDYSSKRSQHHTGD